MADRIFSGVVLLVVIGYGVIAFTAIKAPFQYDPLGPESWPRILSVVAGLCCLAVLARPDVRTLDLSKNTAVRLGILVLLLVIYAALYEPLGFIIATFLFCTVLSRLLGARSVPALSFGLATGVIGFLVGSSLLDLHLPPGLFRALM